MHALQMTEPGVPCRTGRCAVHSRYLSPVPHARLVKLEFHGSNFLQAASSSTRARSSRGCYIRGCRACQATSPLSLPRAYLIGRQAVCCRGVLVPVCPCVVSFSNVREHDLLRTSRWHPRSILVRHARLSRDMLADILARM